MSQRNSFYPSPSHIPSNFKSPLKATSPFILSPFPQQSISSFMSQRTFRSISPRKNIDRFIGQKSPRREIKNFSAMEETLKSGVGLFRHLANQYKQGSQKKQNKPFQFGTNKFQFSQKKKSNQSQLSENSFAFMIQNVKDIQSFNVSQAGVLDKRISFKNMEKFELSQKIKLQKQYSNNKWHQTSLMRKRNTDVETVNVFQSFGSPNGFEVDQNAPKVSIKVSDFAPDSSPCMKESLNTKSEQMISEFEDAIELIKRASDRGAINEEFVHEQNVQVSLSGSKEQQSFNMNPFI